MPEIRLPQEHIDLLVSLSRFSNAQFETILTEVAHSLERRSRSAIVNRLETVIPDLDQEKAGSLLGVILSAQGLRGARGWDLEETVSAIAEAVTPHVGKADLKSMRERLTALLGQPELSRVSRAIDLLGEEERLFHSARIITDIRPVFSEGAQPEPVGSLLVHTLKIDFYAYGGGLKSFFVALDETDLERLGSLVERESAKGQHVRKIIEGTGVPLIELTDEGDDGS